MSRRLALLVAALLPAAALAAKTDELAALMGRPRRIPNPGRC